MKHTSAAALSALLPLLLGVVASATTHAATTSVDWQGVEDRRWPGPAMWANRLQDWSVRGGKLRCAHKQGRVDWRTSHLLTHDLAMSGDRFEVELEFDAAAGGHAGVLLGGGEGKLNYKQAALIQGIPGLGGGFVVDVSFAAKQLCLRDFGADAEVALPAPLAKAGLQRAIKPGTPLVLSVVGERSDAKTIRLTATLKSRGGPLAVLQAEVPTDRLVGSAAIVSRGATQESPHRFAALRLSGDRVAEHADRAYGPIAGVLYSVANGDLKVGVQCLSLGKTIRGQYSRMGVRLEKRQPDGSWSRVARTVGVSEPDYYALVRVKQHDSSQAADFRVVLVNGPKDSAPYAFQVPAEPTDGRLAIGGVSCTGVMGRKNLGDRSLLKPGESFIGVWRPGNLWAPFSGVTEPLIEREPDLVFFTGDQVYEWIPTPADPTDAMPVEDYLYKWTIWHWSFKDVTSRAPCLLQADDHDVWHPNLWGDGPRLMTTGGDSGGGYLKSGYFVNLVQRTMCGHNPDAYSPGPNDSGITNYFCTFNYGGVDFALLEDRKFKSAVPSVKAGADPVMLGDAQVRMLTEWADAPQPAPVRIVVSQTNYITLNTNKSGGMFADRDTNGWPKPARDRAVELFGRAGAMLFTGDQHLASVTRMPTPASENGVYQFSQPASGCIWWRWFYPNDRLRKGPSQAGDGPSYLGRFVDGFGNPFETLAVANPAPPAVMPTYNNTGRRKHILSAQQRSEGVGTESRIHQGEGFGLIRIDTAADRMTLECWPDKSATRTKPYRQFDGWPVQLKLSELR